VPGLHIDIGQMIHIAQTGGEWRCGGDSALAGIGGDPDYGLNQPYYAVPAAAFCSLIVKVGDGAWRGLDASLNVVADRSGTLYLTVNDLRPDICPQPAGPTTCYTDNIGEIDVVVTIA
jgi:hypothetical protein